MRNWLGSFPDFGRGREYFPHRGDDLFMRFMRHLPGMAWLKDLSGRYVYANDAAVKAFGGSMLESLEGRTNADLMPPELAAQCDASDREAAHSGSGLQVLEQYRTSHGSLRTAVVNKFPIAGPDGETAFVGGMAIDITERVQAEEDLRLNEQSLRLAADTARVGIWDWDIDADRVRWTGSLYSIHGVSNESFTPSIHAYLEMLHPDDRSTMQQAIASFLESPRSAEHSGEMEYRAVRPDGRVIWLFTRARVINEDGHPIRMIGATLDVTERKEAELALRESEERFVKAFNASPLSLTLTSLVTGKLIEANDTFVAISGYSREEAIGCTTADLGLWGDNEDRERIMQLLRDIGRIRNLQCRFRTRRGSEFVGLLSAECIVIRGEPFALSVIQDITERERAEAALRNSEERLRLALRAASAGVWMLDARSGEVFWGEQFAPLYGFEDSSPQSFNAWLERVHPDDRDGLLQEYDRRLASDEMEFRKEFRIIHPALGLRWILDLGRIERDASGAVTRMIGINLDITRTKRVEEELREADQRKNQFLATLAHELRNPLAPIRNGLEIMRLTQGFGENAEQARDIMDRQLRQMVRLIDDLLDLSRISRGKVELKREPLDIIVAIQSALEISKPLIDQASHELSVNVPRQALYVHGDVTRLSQIFANLLNNAAKYTPNGGTIRLTVSSQEREAYVSVRDNGIGIAAHMLPKVFEMFTQAERSSDMTQGGLGIGLSIAKQLAEMHGGAIEAYSDGHGTGSEFIVRLPLACASETPAQRDEKRVVAVSGGLRILIADDNVDAAASLAMMLKISGHDVRTACDGLEAVDVAEAFDPEVVLLDIGMPKLSGYDACRRIRQLPGMHGRVIAALTGWGQAEDKRRSQEAGFDHHLVKPVEAEAIERIIEREQMRLHDAKPD